MNNYPASVQTAHEAVERAANELVDLQMTLVERETGPGGRTYGTQDLDRAQRIEDFITDAQSGALDILKRIAPHHYEAQVRQYVKDVEASPVEQGVG